MCGEMAGNPAYIELLIGLGLREFSVAPGELLDVKGAIRRVRLDQARELAERALDLASGAEVEALVQTRFSEHTQNQAGPTHQA
jgi:phosphoenolpyruvate-protein kinase (PTS system EI component)